MRPELDMDRIDPAEMDALARVVLVSVKRAFSDPDYVAGFEAWRKEQSDGKQAG